MTRWEDFCEESHSSVTLQHFNRKQNKTKLFQIKSWPLRTRSDICLCLKKCTIFLLLKWRGKENSLGKCLWRRRWMQETDSAEEEWQSVSWESGKKKKGDLSVTTGVDSGRGSERGRRLLRFSYCLSPGQGSCRPSSRRTPVRSVSLYLCAYLPPSPQPHPLYLPLLSVSCC